MSDLSNCDTESTPSCAVALPRERNCATFEVSSATDCATAVQPTPLKAAALLVLQRNQLRNRRATLPEKLRNFGPQKSTPELRTHLSNCDTSAGEPDADATPARWVVTEYVTHCSLNRDRWIAVTLTPRIEA